MRAATAIVGAIAASSVLIALALILPGGGSSGEGQKTTTVTERTEATKLKSKAEEPAAQKTGVAPVGGPTECDGGEFTVEDVSCEVGEEIHRQYEEGGHSGLIAEDKEANETITMTCEVSTPVICEGPGGARVYFEP